jgi:DNA-binding transcriptional regulator/RsmH inhibitor MraZ
MKTGRPPSWNPVASLDPGVWTEVVEFASKGRIGIPVAARRRLSWFDGAAADGLLATLESDGAARLRPWRVNGEAMLRGIREAMAASPELRSEIALAGMDRFMHVSVEEPGRIVAPANLIAHLGSASPGFARVVVVGSELSLWSEAAWQAKRSERLALLPLFEN